MLPRILRAIVGHEGHPMNTCIELSLQRYYFVFLFSQTFLTVSLSSSITGMAQDVLYGLGSVPLLVAQNLPKSCNYFFSYLIILGFSVSAATLLQVGGLLAWLVISPLTDRTPRQKWERLKSLPEIQWGTIFPLNTTLACIGESFATPINLSPAYTVALAYSAIAPLILVFAAITFGLFGVVFRYHLLNASVIRYDTGGGLYPTALKQLFTGIYVLELCLIGLFLAIRNRNSGFAGIGQLVLITLSAAATAIFHIVLERSFASILRHLPASRHDDCHSVSPQNEPLAAEGPGRASTRALRMLHGLIVLISQQPSSLSPSLRASIHELARRQKKHAQSRSACKETPASYDDPIISIPESSLGLKEEEVLQARKRIKDLRFTSGLAKLDENGYLLLSQSVNSIDEEWLDGL